MYTNNVQLRLEVPADYRTVEDITREAFWNLHVPGCNEHYLVHLMRNANSFMKELDIVATIDQKIVGNIMYTKAKIMGDDGKEYPVLCFGPISVLPAFQGRGIGTMLIEYTKEIARKLGHTAILIYGNPDYYSKVGFVAAEQYEIGTAENMFAVPLQACELIKGSLAKCKGRFIEDSIYDIDDSAAEEFDKTFPLKELLNNAPSQETFRQLVKMRIPR